MSRWRRGGGRGGEEKKPGKTCCRVLKRLIELTEVRGLRRDLKREMGGGGTGKKD